MVGDRSQPAQPLPAHGRRHPRVVEDGLDRVEGQPAARAVRAHLASCSRPATTTPSARAELIERRVETRRTAAAGGAAQARASTTRRSSELLRHDAAPLLHLRTRPTQIARHARVAMRYRARASCSRTAVARHARRASRELIVCTRDVHGLFSNVAGVISGAPHQHPRRARLHHAQRAGARDLPPGDAGRRRRRARARCGGSSRPRSSACCAARSSVGELLKRRGRPLGT